MINSKTFKYCEYCNRAWEDISPPTKEEYRNGFIKIGEFSSVLLNIKIGSHAKDLEGIYCNIKCLSNYIKKVRKNK